MKTLIYCPVHRLEPETVDAILRIKSEGSVDIVFGHGQFTGDDRADILNAYEKGRWLALEGNYDAMLTVESDIIPPEDALLKLASCDRPVAYGAYIMRRGEPALNLRYHAPGQKQAEIGQSLTRYPDLVRSAGSQPILVSGVGLGCTLIRRYVLESISFRMGAHSHCDWWLAVDCLRAGYEQVGHLGVLCGHKHESGIIAWPTPCNADYLLIAGNPDRSYWRKESCQSLV